MSIFDESTYPVTIFDQFANTVATIDPSANPIPNGPSTHLSAPILKTGLAPIGSTLARIDTDHANPLPIGGPKPLLT